MQLFSGAAILVSESGGVKSETEGGGGREGEEGGEGFAAAKFWLGILPVLVASILSGVAAALSQVCVCVCVCVCACVCVCVCVCV
jgi:hypothetical protein